MVGEDSPGRQLPVENEEMVREFIRAEFGRYETLKVVEGFRAESDEGNVEYKRMLIQPSPDRLKHLITQMKYRVKEGHGQGFYRLGVEDNGTPCGLNLTEMEDSLVTLCRMASSLKF